MINITHLTSGHTRYDIRIFHKECISLAKVDSFTVNLIVADNDKDEIKDNISIYDVGKLNGRYHRMLKTTKKILQKAIELDSDLYHFHDPELIPIGLKLKKLGKKVIFDIHENTGLQILERQWIPYYLRKIISVVFDGYEQYACSKFDYLYVPQYSMYKKFTKINNTEFIGNFPSIENINSLKAKDYSKYKLLYSGSISESRGLFNMLNLLVELMNIDIKYTITIAGSIGDDLLKKAKTHKGWQNINYLGYLSQEEIQKVYSKHSIGLIMFNNVGQYYMAYSLKLFEYMQNGLTIIMPNFGDWLYFNKEYNVGYNINVKDSSDISIVIDGITNEVLKLNGIRNQKLVIDEFSWNSEEKKLKKIYKEILNVK
jgi:hypothetical protein